jgi:H+-translocating NAD(P) transhydrogenase subunit alpha
MVVGVPKETAPDERRVAMVPDVVKRLAAKDVEVVVEAGAGEAALIPDALFEEAGAKIGDPWSADVVVKVAAPSPEELGKLSDNAVLVGFLAPLTSPETTRALADAGATAFAMEAIPRISRAQSMDALSSQSNVAGYKAALLGAEHATRFYPMLTTAAGTIPPAKVLVLGGGVAGLQALATAKRLGARTTGYDVRPEVAEQVQSLGANWLDLGIEAVGEGGYARELTEEEQAQQKQALTDAIKDFDVVITTALVPGRRAPVLVTAEAVEGMKPGSVVVDLAGEAGGNCELTEPGEVVVKSDVTIVSPLNLPTTMPEHASQLYARNVQALIELMLDDEGNLNLDFEDEIIAGACVVRDGEIVHEGAKKTVAAFTGYLVISKVPNTLHTPLMSGTNAVHGIVVLGGIIVLGLGVDDFFTKILLVIAIAFGTINVVGGFLVTDRMLEMFKSKPKEAVETSEDLK